MREGVRPAAAECVLPAVSPAASGTARWHGSGLSLRRRGAYYGSEQTWWRDRTNSGPQAPCLIRQPVAGARRRHATCQRVRARTAAGCLALPPHNLPPRTTARGQPRGYDSGRHSQHLVPLRRSTEGSARQDLSLLPVSEKNPTHKNGGRAKNTTLLSSDPPMLRVP